MLQWAPRVARRRKKSKAAKYMRRVIGAEGEHSPRIDDHIHASIAMLINSTVEPDWVVIGQVDLKDQGLIKLQCQPIEAQTLSYTLPRTVEPDAQDTPDHMPSLLGMHGFSKVL